LRFPLFRPLINFVAKKGAGQRLAQQFQCAGANPPGSLDLFDDASSLNGNASGML
jgi:hypothetical protein